MTTRDMMRRAATLAPTTFNAEANTVEAVLSTGADVQRFGYVERLPVANANLRSIAGKPVLDTHNTYSTRAVLGVIEKAWRAEGEIRALIKLSSRDDAAGTVRDIRDGILRSISIGYSVAEWKDKTDPGGKRTRTAMAWEILEASFCPIGADLGAVTRSQTMKKTKKTGGVDDVQDAADVQDDVQDDTAPRTRTFQGHIALRGITLTIDPDNAEHRAGAIRTWAGQAQLSDEETAEFIESDDDLGDIFRDIRKAAKRSLEERGRRVPNVRVVNPGVSPEQDRDVRSEALAVRLRGGKPSDAAKGFVGYSLVEHARDMLEANGTRTRGMNAETILTRAAHTLSDFPELLTGTGARLLRPAYEAALSPLVALCRKLTAVDFRAQSLLQVGEFPNLQEVAENGEIENVTRGEAKESWRLKTYASIFSLSRQALINDDLNAFADFSTAAGQAAAGTVADLIVAALTENAGEGLVMGDGLRLFVAGHANIGAGEIDLESISAARVAMMTQTGVNGETLIDVRPDTLVVPPSRLTEAEQFTTTIAPNVAGEVNPFASKLTAVCDPRLEAVSSVAWYLAASNLPALVLGGLSGAEGPQIASRDGFDVLGREFRVHLDAGVGAHDFRGWFRSTGESG